jgi:ketosteroid isomerase-like protein
MSTENEKIVKQINDSFLAGSTDKFLEFCTEDVTWTMVGEKANKGKAAIREWMKQMPDMGPPQFTVDKMISDDNSVVCYGDMKMKGESGAEEEYSYCDIYEFSGDKVSELRSFVVKHKPEGEKQQAATT